MTGSATKAYEFGEKLGIFLGGIGIGAVVAQEALIPDSAETSLPLLVVALGVVVSGYFQRKRD